jgi:hypothetical protein
LSVAVEEVLGLWREAERLLDELPLGPERTAVLAEVEQLHILYTALTDRASSMEPIVNASASVIEDARRLLERTRERRAAT